MSRIAIVAADLQQGGTQKVIAMLAGDWVARGHRVDIISFEAATATPLVDLPPAASLHRLDLLRRSRNPLQAAAALLQRVTILRAKLRALAPDIVISFIDQTNIICLLATRMTGLPVIVAERSSPAVAPLPRAWQILRRLTYPWTTMLVVQSRQAAAFFRWLRRPIAVISNPAPAATPLVQNSTEPPTILALGRLSPEKGFDLLLRAFARAAAHHPHWRLLILGEGPEREALQSIAADLMVTDRVDLAGWVRHPWDAVQRADLYVLTSRFEGFPNALIEAMARGLPAVAFDCPDCVGEIVRHEIDGLLVPPDDVDALATALDTLMTDPERRRRYAARAPEVMSRLSPSSIFNAWHQAISQVAKP